MCLRFISYDNGKKYSLYINVSVVYMLPCVRNVHHPIWTDGTENSNKSILLGVDHCLHHIVHHFLYMETIGQRNVRFWGSRAHGCRRRTRNRDVLLPAQVSHRPKRCQRHLGQHQLRGQVFGKCGHPSAAHEKPDRVRIIYGG